MTKADGRGSRGLVAVAVTLFLYCHEPLHADTVETSGDVLRVAIPAAAWVVAWRRDDAEGQKQFAYSLAATVASTLALKAVVDKERPNGDSDAFPSGHTATSFAGASFLHRRYGWRDALPAYLLSAYVGWTRVDADEHDTVDVLGGAALATAWSWFLVEPRDDVQVTPLPVEDGAGIQVSMRW